MNQKMKDWGRRVLTSASAIGLCLGAIGCQGVNNGGPKILEPRATKKGTVPAPYLSPTTASKHKGAVVDPFTHRRVNLPSPVTPQGPVKAPMRTHKPIVNLPEIPQGSPTRIVKAPALPSVNKVKPLTYQVRKGDTLSEIAVMHKVSVGEIASTNNMKKNDILHVGRILTMPPGAVKPSASELASHKPKPQEKPRYHIVQNGEILSRIALKYDVGVQDLVAWNKLSSAHKIYKGQKLAINEAASGGIKSRSKVSTTRRVKRPIPASGIHKVKKNESWWKIAHSYKGLDSRQLQAINAPKTTLHPGDIVYLTQAAAGKRVAGKKDEITGSRPAEATPLPKDNVYTVKPGDNLSRIASMFGTTVRKLREANNLSSDTLMPNDTLIILQPGNVSAAKPKVKKDRNPDLVKNNTKETPLVSVNKENFTMLPHFVDQSSDTLEEIAEMYGSKVKWILDANPKIKGNNDLRKVKEILVPVEDLNLSGN